jgi:hypothetical protein
MDGRSRKPMQENTDDEIVRALARSSPRSSLRVRRFRHAGKSYIAHEGGVPGTAWRK